MKMEIADKIFHPLFKKLPGRGMLIAGLAIVILVILLAILAPVLSPYDPTKSTDDTFAPPSSKHPMGTNRIGQDMFSRILWGARIMIYVVAIATVTSMSIGIPIGLISGYYRGKLDRTLSIIMDSIYAFPAIILAIVISVALGPSPMNTAVAISFVYVPTYFRMIRGQTLSFREQLFVEGARAVGASNKDIMFKYILPNLVPTILVVFSLSVADTILTEAGLSFLGLSVTPPTPDWGYDLKVGQPFLLDGYWWLVVFPGLMIMLFAMAFALIGEALSERTSLGTR
jgi:peptide/nickel transport system permease protein